MKHIMFIILAAAIVMGLVLATDRLDKSSS